MAQRQSNRDRFDPYEQYAAGNDENYGGRGRRDEEREAWGSGRMRGEGWQDSDRRSDDEPSRSHDANASRYRGGYGGQNERWSEEHQSGWRRRPLGEDQYRGGAYGGGSQEYGPSGGRMGGYGSGAQSDYGQGGRGRESFGQASGRGAWQDPGYGYGYGYGGGATDSSWGRGEQPGTGGAPGSAQRGGREGDTWHRSFRGIGPQGYERSDDRLKEMICERLTEDHDIDPSGVQIQVNRGEVTLEGHVGDRPTKFRIEDVVEACGGVKEIHNHLRVQQNAGQQGGTPSGQHSGQLGSAGSQTGQQGSTDKLAKGMEKSGEQAGKQQR